jgi:hypothetical protein
MIYLFSSGASVFPKLRGHLKVQLLEKNLFNLFFFAAET